MNDLIITDGLKELKSGLKNVKKEKSKEFDYIVNLLLQRFGSKIETIAQKKNDDDLFCTFSATLDDGLCIELKVGKQ